MACVVLDCRIFLNWNDCFVLWLCLIPLKYGAYALCGKHAVVCRPLYVNFEVLLELHKLLLVSGRTQAAC